MGSEDIRDKVFLGGKMMLCQGNQGNIEMWLENACMLRIYEGNMAKRRGNRNHPQFLEWITKYHVKSDTRLDA